MSDIRKFFTNPKDSSSTSSQSTRKRKIASMETNSPRKKKAKTSHASEQPTIGRKRSRVIESSDSSSDNIGEEIVVIDPRPVKNPNRKSQKKDIGSTKKRERSSPRKKQIIAGEKKRVRKSPRKASGDDDPVIDLTQVPTPSKDKVPVKEPRASASRRRQASPRKKVEIKEKTSPKTKAPAKRTQKASTAKQGSAKQPSQRNGAKSGISSPQKVTTPEPGTEAVAKKASYFAFKTRPQAPPLKGSKPLPVGQPNCLVGKFFIITGVLDSLEREECSALIQKYGGGVCKTVAKKVTHAVVGEGFGEAKMKIIKQRDISVLSEDDLFDMISSAKGTQLPGGLTPQDAKLKQQMSKIHLPEEAEIRKSGKPVSKVETLLWADKYRPISSKDLVGNPGPIATIKSWLSDWHANFAGQKDSVNKGAKKSAKKGRALLISGVPGIGKTTAVTIIAKEMGYDYVQKNASDARNKSALAKLGETVSNTSIASFFPTPSASSSKAKPCVARSKGKKALLIMDEVDGMSSGDRGGMAELCRMIDNTSIPIICICNDRQAKSVRSLANHCTELKFKRPTLVQLRARINKIAANEGFKFDSFALDQILQCAHGDVRQVLNLLQLWRTTTKGDNMATTELSSKLQDAKKDMTFGAFEILPRLYSKEISVPEKVDLYFMDYDFLPLMVHDTYPSAIPSGPDELDALSKAADSVSEGDLINTSIRSKQNFGLLPVEAIVSSIRPAALTGGHLGGFVTFPRYLGKIKKQKKLTNLLNDAKLHCYPKSFCDAKAMVLDYLPLYVRKMYNPLTKGQSGIDEVADFMDEYEFQLEDRENFIDLASGLSYKLATGVATATKSGLTRRYKKEHYDFRKVAKTKSKKKKPVKGKKKG